MPMKTRLVMAGLMGHEGPNRQDLIDNFGRGEVAVQTFLRGETKTAALGAAYLRRQAEGIVIGFRDQDTFDDFAVGQPERKFLAAVNGLLPLPAEPPD